MLDIHTNPKNPVIGDRALAEQEQEMLINVAQPEECRIAIVEDGTLEELYIELLGSQVAGFYDPELDYIQRVYKTEFRDALWKFDSPPAPDPPGEDAVDAVAARVPQYMPATP